jgi:hypothetical protein
MIRDGLMGSEFATSKADQTSMKGRTIQCQRGRLERMQRSLSSPPEWPHRCLLHGRRHAVRGGGQLSSSSSADRLLCRSCRSSSSSSLLIVFFVVVADGAAQNGSRTSPL